MADIISNVVEQRKSIDQLFKRSNEGRRLRRANFLTWSDELRPVVDIDKVCPENKEIISWDNVCDSISNNAAATKRISNKKKNPLGFFSVTLPQSWEGPPCPNIKEISNRLKDESLIPLVFNFQGYSFTSEFNMVYKGTFSQVTAYEDLLAIIRKSLLSADPAIGNDVCEQYAIYIVAQIAWDATAMSAIFHEYISQRFPKIEKFQMKPEEVGLNSRVYVGKSNLGHISFTVRFECFASFSDVTIKKNEEIVPIPFIMYHDHDIESLESIKEFLTRLQYISSEVDAVRANASRIKFSSFFSNAGLRFYLKVNVPTPTTGRFGDALNPPNHEVDSDLSDDDNDNNNESQSEVNNTLPFKYDAVELDSLAPVPPYCSNNASFGGELYGWGYDSFYSLGVGNASRSQSEGRSSSKGSSDKNKTGENDNNDAAKLLDEVYEPRPIPINRNIALEQVRMIACSARHSVLLTQFGSLYACGDNAEGALGLGDMYPRNVFTFIDFSLGGGHGSNPSLNDNQVGRKITYVACGAGVAGAHTLAIDDQGLLYGWGFTKAIGRGTVQPTLTPHLIPIPGHADTEFEDELMDNVRLQQERQSGRRRPPSEMERQRDDGLSLEEKRRRRMVRTVACGAGFSICVMMSGEVYSFGQWAHGRLGLGPIPKMSVRGRGLRATPKLARYQLRPVRLLGIENAVSAACGEAHVLCLLASGHVLTWGQNALGQLGIGPMRSGLLKDQFEPVLLPPFGSFLSNESKDSKASLPMQKYHQQLIRRFVLDGAGPRYQRRLQYLYQSPHSSGNSGNSNVHAIKGLQVVCGAYHSIVVDRDNHVWTWGARGSPCLGHADSKILGDWSNRVLHIFSVATNETEIMVPFELLPWCNLWSTPRRVRAFDTYYSQPHSSGGHHTDQQNQTRNHFYFDDYALVDQQYQQATSTTAAVSHNDEDNDDEPDSMSTAAATLDDDMTIISHAHHNNSDAQQSTDKNANNRLKIVQVVAGDLHTLFITNHGRLYLCGSGPAVPPLFPSDLDLDEAISDLQTKQQQKEAAKQLKDRAVVVHSPRCPSAQWLAPVCMRAVRYVSSGGCRVFAFFDEETVSLNLTSRVYRHLKPPHRPQQTSTGHLSDTDDDDTDTKSGLFSLLSGVSGLVSDYSQVLLQKGRADCMVIASGYSFLCHRALLAKRSTELRDMILLETPTVSEGDGLAPSHTVEPLTQILLPELHRDAARVLAYFLYTDTLPRYVLGDRVLLHALSRCGQNLKLPRLHLLAERLLTLVQLPHSLNYPELYRNSPKSNARNNNNDDDDGDNSASSLDEMPPPTLSRDLGNMLGDPDFADVRFIAEGRSVAAHRFILEARCAYFRAMFQSNFSETSSYGGSKSANKSVATSNLVQQRIVDVVVPDSFVGFLRLLIFIYTDTLPDGSDGALLEDLMAADRYGLLDMKSLCENMLIPNRENWLDLLRAADLLHAHTLKRNVVSFLRDNFHALHLDLSTLDAIAAAQEKKQAKEEAQADDFDSQGNPIVKAKATSPLEEDPAPVVIQELKEEFPQLLESLLFSRQVTFPLPPNQMLITRSVTSKQAKIEAEQTPFPYWALVLGAVCMYLYTQVSSFVALGPLIPAINIGITIVASIYGAYVLYKELYKKG